MTAPTGDTLVPLSESTLTVSDPRADVRGRKVVDATGEEVGTVDDLLVDDAEVKVRMLRVKHGGFLGIGADHFLIPVDAISSVTDDAVHIDRERRG
jgi:sporulation protein YlmC with PRC-barrel domain